MDYIKENLKKGHPEEKIKSALVKFGYNSDALEHQFEKLRSYNKYKYITLIVIFLILIIFATYFYIHSKEPAKLPGKNDSLEIKKQAFQSFFNGKYSLAIEQSNEFLKQNPNDYEAMLLLGYSYMHLDDYGKTLSIFQKTLNSSYPDYRIFYALGLAYYELEEYDKSFLYMNTSYTLNPRHKKVISLMVSNYNAIGLYDEAIKLSQMQLEIEKNNSDYYRKEAISYYLKNDLNKSLSQAQEAVRLNPDFTWNRLTLGLIYLRLGDYNNSIVQFEKSLELEKRDKTYEQFKRAKDLEKVNIAYNGLYVAYKLMNNSKDAEESLKNADLYPVNAFSVSITGLGLLDIKEYDFAIYEFELAKKKQPNYYLPYKGLGKAYLALDQKEKAQENFRKANELNNYDVEVKNMLYQLN